MKIKLIGFGIELWNDVNKPTNAAKVIANLMRIDAERLTAQDLAWLASKGHWKVENAPATEECELVIDVDKVVPVCMTGKGYVKLWKEN